MHSLSSFYYTLQTIDSTMLFMEAIKRNNPLVICCSNKHFTMSYLINNSPQINDISSHCMYRKISNNPRYRWLCNNSIWFQLCKLHVWIYDSRIYDHWCYDVSVSMMLWCISMMLWIIWESRMLWNHLRFRFSVLKFSI